MVDMNDDEKRVFFQNWHDQWIQPELNRRFGETGMPDDFRIREVLIKLPSNQAAIIEINDEIQWELKCKVSEDLLVELDQIVYLHEAVNIEEVMPPIVEGKRVAFMYLYWDGFKHRLFVDFLPNQPDYDISDQRFKFDGTVISQHLQNWLIERVVRWARIHQSKLQQIGMWTAIPLLPYPLSRIVERVDEGELEEARQILVNHCNAEFISTKLVQTWRPIKVFRERQQIFEDALFSHEHQKYHGSISTLILQIEGVIADWLHEVIQPSDVKWRIQSRVNQFRDVMRTIPQFEYAFKEALESTIEFLREGENAPKPFQAFKNWLDSVDPNFPSRNALGHGKYVPDIYTEENSIKLFLLLDTICQFMMFYEVRVLGRNLGQDKE
jgi:hypothetical protein